MSEPPSPSAEPEGGAVFSAITVPFCDTDAMGVVHHKNYVRYVEVARVAFVKQRLGSIADRAFAGHNLAVTEMSIRYLRAARFDDSLQVSCRLGWCKSVSLCFEYQIRRGGELLSEARTEHALVDAQGRLLRISPAARDALQMRGAARAPLESTAVGSLSRF